MTKKPKNVFVVGRSDDDPAAEKLRVELRGLGYIVISDWLNKPQPRSRLGQNALVATKRAVATSDIIVILKNDVAGQPSSLSKLFEMLGDSAARGEKKEILLVGGNTGHEIQFFLHRLVHLSDEQAVVFHLARSTEGSTVH